MRVPVLTGLVCMIAAIASAANDSKLPSFPSAQVFEHHDSAGPSLLAEANLEGAAVHEAAPLKDEGRKATALRWQWLKGTTWYVPLELPLTGFFLLNGQTVVPVMDQTVYQLNDYREGYFWGKLVKSLSGQLNCESIIGSVTPEGWIQMSLVTQDLSNVSHGTGTMRSGTVDGRWNGRAAPGPTRQTSIVIGTT